MIASVLLLLIGVADVARSHPSRLISLLGMALAWGAVGIVSAVGLGVPMPAVAVCIALAIGWVVAMPVNRTPLWPALVLVLVVAILAASDVTAAGSSGPLVDTYTRLHGGALDAVSAQTAIAALAVAVFLTRTANIVARAALGRTHLNEPVDTAQAPPGWVVRVRGRVLGSIDQTPHATPASSALRGGRLIGPIERLLIVVLALAGAHTIIAALVAAKGVVRFPEISADRGSGSKAEEFLVGSLTSWAMSAAAVLYLFAVHNS